MTPLVYQIVKGFTVGVLVGVTTSLVASAVQEIEARKYVMKVHNFNQRNHDTFIKIVNLDRTETPEKN